MRAFYENRHYRPDAPISVSHASDLTFLAHWHMDIELIYVREGGIRIGIDQESRDLKQGDLALCGSNAIHYYDSSESASSVMIIIFRPEWLAGCMGDKSFSPESLFLTRGDQDALHADLAPSLRSIFNRVLSDATLHDEASPVYLMSGTMAAMAELIRHCPQWAHASRTKSGRHIKPSETKPMQEALVYLEQHYQEEIALDDLARRVNLSKFYLSRLFKATTGMHFQDYLNRIRVDNAEKMIAGGGIPMIEIAYENGFGSIRSFNRVFKSVMGCSPTILRSGGKQENPKRENVQS